jgi:hypothetical protein
MSRRHPNAVILAARNLSDDRMVRKLSAIRSLRAADAYHDDFLALPVASGVV